MTGSTYGGGEGDMEEELVEASVVGSVSEGGTFPELLHLKHES